MNSCLTVWYDDDPTFYIARFHERTKAATEVVDGSYERSNLRTCRKIGEIFLTHRYDVIMTSLSRVLGVFTPKNHSSLVFSQSIHARMLYNGLYLRIMIRYFIRMHKISVTKLINRIWRHNQSYIVRNSNVTVLQFADKIMSFSDFNQNVIDKSLEGNAWNIFYRVN